MSTQNQLSVTRLAVTWNWVLQQFKVEPSPTFRSGQDFDLDLDGSGRGWSEEITPDVSWISVWTLELIVDAADTRVQRDSQRVSSMWCTSNRHLRPYSSTISARASRDQH
jgi:hypothetical protein